MEYRRAFVPGGSFFFTVVTERRRRLFVTSETVDVLRNAFRSVMAKRPFKIDALVVLPDHLHCVWSLPPEDADFATRWRLVKTWFTKHCASWLREASDQAHQRKGQQSIWQHRYWEHVLRDEMDLHHHVDYIHYNPVKHGYVCRPVDWPYSSMRRYVDAGMYSEDWGTGAIALPEDVGNE